MHRVLCLKNALEFYSLKPTEKICFAFINIKKDLAEEIAISKFQKTIQLSPWFMKRGRMTQFHNNNYWVPPDPLSIIIGSQSDDLIGLPIFALFADEISFIRNQDIDKQKQKAIDMIDTGIGGMKTRFIKNGVDPTLLVLASSKRSDNSFLESHIKQKLESEPDNVIIVDKPVWEVKPKGTYSSRTFRVGVGNKFLESIVIPDDEDIIPLIERGYKILNVPIDFRPNFLDDISRALCDFAGISSSELSKYISGAAVSTNINRERKNPFSREVLEIGNAPEDTAQYYNFFDLNAIKDIIDKPCCVHLDMSVTGDISGIGGVFITGKKVGSADAPGRDLMMTLGFSVGIKAPKGRQISFEKNRNFIRWLREQGVRILQVSADTYQSFDLLQQLESEGFKTAVLSVDRVDSDHICKPYQAFRSTLYENRLQLYECPRLTGEITELERNINTGKVDHPPNGHKDICDAVCGAVYDCMQFAELYAFDYGEDLDTISDVNSYTTNEEQVKQQIQLDFEEELKRAFGASNLDLQNVKETEESFNAHSSMDNGLDFFYAASGIIL